MSAGLWGALAGMGLSMLQERKKAKETQKWNQLQGEIEQYAGLTGKHGKMVPGGKADYLGAGLTGALGGMRAGQEIGKALEAEEGSKYLDDVFTKQSPSEAFASGARDSKYSMLGY